jgi:hypothetical protein
MPTPSAQQALSILRDGSHFQWYVIPIFVLVVYVYANEVERRNWRLVFAGLMLWATDWFFEIINSLVFHFTNYAPLWGAPGETAYLPLIGLNIEISLNFAILGIVFAKMLPADRNLKVLGVPNRPFFAIMYALICVFIEVILNSINALTWDYPWWSARFPWLIIFVAYLPLVSSSIWVYDMKSVRSKAATVVTVLVLDVLCLLVFGSMLKWI